MNKLVNTGIIFISILLLLVAVANCGGGSKNEDENSPEKTIYTLLDAYEDLDVETILNCLVPEAEERTVIEEAFYSMKDMDISYSITNRKVSVISQTDDTATFSVSFTSKSTIEGQVETENVDEIWTLVKRNGDWLITGFPPPED